MIVLVYYTPSCFVLPCHRANNSLLVPVLNLVLRSFDITTCAPFGILDFMVALVRRECGNEGCGKGADKEKRAEYRTVQMREYTIKLVGINLCLISLELSPLHVISIAVHGPLKGQSTSERRKDFHF
jgi:hypothetical protein